MAVFLQTVHLKIKLTNDIDSFEQMSSEVMHVATQLLCMSFYLSFVHFYVLIAHTYACITIYK